MAPPVAAQNIDAKPPSHAPTFASIVRMPTPVIASDITYWLYRVIGEMETGVKELAIWSQDPSEANIYAELWERGKKMGAGAVIHVNHGDPCVTFTSWGSRKAKGLAGTSSLTPIA